MDALKDYESDSDGGGGGGGEEEEEEEEGSDRSAVVVVEKKEGEEEEEEEEETPRITTTAPPLVPVARPPDRRHVRAAPAAQLMAGRGGGADSTAREEAAAMVPAVSGDLVLTNNPAKAAMRQPVHGPAVADPASRRKGSRSFAGRIRTDVAFDEATFRDQRAAFARTGRALAPTEEGGEQVVLRTALGYRPSRLEEMAAREEERRAKRPRPESYATSAVRKKEEEEDLVMGSDDEAEYGVWGPPSAEERLRADNALTDVQRGGLEALAPEQLAEREYIRERDRQRGVAETEKEEESKFERLVERKMAHLLPPRMKEEEAVEPKTTFHGKEEFDYRGRSWMEPPAGLGSLVEEEGLADHRCFVPKKCVHRFTGHNKGVHRIRLFPGTGHLILSAGLDGKCKVWSVPQKQVMRTYEGHTAAVRDVQFNRDGTKFVSASFDRFLRLWKTETGEVLQTFTNRKVPYVVKFYPHDDNFFVVGCSDNKIVTYDATTAEITQEYAHHLAPVNAIVFVEDHGTKMVSSGDDKKVLVWEWDIGVPIKYISDPSMHSMPCMVMHPSQQFFVGQSLDNTIVVFQAGGKFALQRKKKFSGHIVSGYACEMAFSPDGQFMVSGDGNGSLFFWDWKKHKILQKYRAHSQGPAICCAWHPLEPSVMFSCGWDGVIKMWQ